MHVHPRIPALLGREAPGTQVMLDARACRHRGSKEHYVAGGQEQEVLLDGWLLIWQRAAGGEVANWHSLACSSRGTPGPLALSNPRARPEAGWVQWTAAAAVAVVGGRRAASLAMMSIRWGRAMPPRLCLDTSPVDTSTDGCKLAWPAWHTVAWARQRSLARSRKPLRPPAIDMVGAIATVRLPKRQLVVR